MSNGLKLYRSLGVKRLMLEAQELKEKTEDYCAQPIDDNLFEWHFTVRGPPDTAFEGGYYHGRLSFPTEYPMKPPSIILFTPNGRFSTNRKICLSISGFHPETWQPSWSIRTALLALIAFMPTESHGAVGSLECSDERRRYWAKKSSTWRCETCGLIKDLLVNPNDIVPDIQNKPSTSRVCDNSVDAACDAPIKSSRARGSDSLDTSEDSSSSSEQRDSSPDSEQEKLLDCRLNFKCSRAGAKRKSTNFSDSVESTNVAKAQDLSFDHNRDLSSNRHTFIQDRRIEERNLMYRYPPIVIKLVFVLLSLLILRRIVMVIQS